MNLSRPVVWLVSAATGLAVACNYYVHPLIAVVGETFAVPPADTGFFITLSQFSYALGLIFLVPLGDLFDSKKLVLLLFGLVAGACLLTAAAPTLAVFLAGIFLMGFLCTVAQVLLPMAAGLADPARRGRVVGTVMTGLLTGILLSRTFSGWIAQWFGWRVVYLLAAALLFAVAAALTRYLPAAVSSRSGLRYGATLRSVWVLLLTTPLLRRRALLGGLVFALFTILWTPLTLLLTHEPYRYGVGTIGLFGLLGLLGIFGASVSGRLADRGGAYAVTAGCALLFLPVWWLLYAGTHILWALVVGIILLDFAVQAVHITNQSLIYRGDPSLRSRIASGYMSVYFIGGVLGSLSASYAYSQSGWHGVCILGAAVSLVLVLCALMFRNTRFEAKA